MEPTIQTLMQLKTRNEQQGAIIRDAFKEMNAEAVVRLTDVITEIMRSKEVVVRVIGSLAYVKLGELLEQRANS